MARINIETSLWGKTAFQNLLIKVGDRHKAKGMVVELFTLAQKFWFPKMELIPIDAIHESDLEPCLNAGLAEERDGFAYVFGTEKSFAWLFQKSTAGHRSGEARQKKSKKNKIERTLTDVERTLTDANVRQRDGTSLLSSPSSLLFSPTLNSNSQLSTHIGEVEKNETPSANAGALIAAYCRLWKARYGSRPEVLGKDKGIAKRLANDLGGQRAVDLMEAYFKMNDSWIIERHHDLATFESKMNAVVQFQNSGRVISRDTAREIERTERFKDQLKRIEEGTL